MGSIEKNKEIFEKLDLNPQIFLDETLISINKLFDGAFNHFQLEASTLLKTDGTDLSEDLKLGINCIRTTVQTSLDKRFIMWEQYCLHHCFVVPSGFSLPSENETSADDSMDLDDDSDEQLDAQLDMLRSKIAEAEKECSELSQELKKLETKSALTDHCASAVNEALALYDSSSAQDMFQEILRVGAELRQKMNQLKTKPKEDLENNQRERFDVSNGDLCKLKSDVLQEFIAEMNL